MVSPTLCWLSGERSLPIGLIVYISIAEHWNKKPTGRSDVIDHTAKLKVEKCRWIPIFWHYMWRSNKRQPSEICSIAKDGFSLGKKVNILEFWTLFIFILQNVGYQGWNLQNTCQNSKQGRPWSDCFSSSIQVTRLIHAHFKYLF